MPDRLILTCEHGGNRVPARYTRLFTGADRILASHRGHDIGALTVARKLARSLGAPLFAATVSRLVVDLNRSQGHPGLFSEYTQALDADEQQRIVTRHYLPHRQTVERAIAGLVQARQRVLHVAVHSFTPVLRGERRRADVGLLYDPARPGERALCAQWKAHLAALAPALRVRRNYPYRGQSDGFTTYLRTRFPDHRYVGIELELNQGMLQSKVEAQLAEAIETSLRALLASHGGLAD